MIVLIRERRNNKVNPIHKQGRAATVQRGRRILATVSLMQLIYSDTRNEVGRHS